MSWPTGTSVPTHRVDFIDEDDAGRALLRLLEHVAHPGCTDPDEHLDEVGARDREKRHLGLAGNGLGQQSLAGSRRADQQHPTWDATAELLKLLRILQEVDQLLDLFLGLIAAGDVGKRGGVVGLVEHARLALAKTERSALAAALHLAHEVHPDADQQQHRAPADQQADQQRRLFTRLDVELDAVADQIADQTAVEVGGGRTDALVIVGDGQNLGTAIALLQRDDLDALGAHLFKKIGVADHRARRHPAVELLEHGEKHECDHHPNSDLREPLIVHRGSFSQIPVIPDCTWQLQLQSCKAVPLWIQRPTDGVDSRRVKPHGRARAPGVKRGIRR